MKSSAEIMAEIAALGPMLPGSVRKTTAKVKRNGKVFEYEAQPIYTSWDPQRKKQVPKRIPKSAYETVRTMTLEHMKFEKLLAEFDRALVRENLSGVGSAKKKHS